MALSGETTKFVSSDGSLNSTQQLAKFDDYQL